jgi:hypothetical protein
MSILSEFVVSLSGSTVLCFIFAWFFNNGVNMYMRWGKFSISSTWEAFTQNSIIVFLAIVIASLLIILGGFVNAYISKNAKMLQLSIQSVIATALSTIIGSYVATGPDLDFIFVIILIVAPIAILASYIANVIIMTKQNKKVILESIESSGVQYPLFSINFNIVFAGIFAYMHIVNIAAIFFLDKSLLVGVSDLLPQFLKNLYAQIIIFVPFIMFTVSIFLRQSRNKKLITIGLWLFCIIGLGIQLANLHLRII